MCGRFTLHTPEARLAKAFQLDEQAFRASGQVLQPRYNIAPSQDIPVIRNTGTGRELLLARWGLVPAWSREPKTGYATINARIETVADKPAYRTAFRHRRCLIPADGFYEWQTAGKQKVPHYIHMQDGLVFAFAGLWEHWESGDAGFDSCTIIVQPSCGMMQSIHGRMPAIVAPANYDCWLDAGLTDRQEILQCLDATPYSRLQAHPVGTFVNSPQHEGARCLQPAG
jgi:putative SOS response-associated peptidase YedK